MRIPDTNTKSIKTNSWRPSKKLGQNFLVDKNVLRKIISASDLSENDIVLEVGPGSGILTLALASRVKKIIAVEKDKKMVDVLQTVLLENSIKNVEITNADILRIENLKLQGDWKVVANIPYYLTSALIRKFLESPHPPSLLVLLVQKEVAQRICARPPDMSLLSVAVQFYAEAKIISFVSKKSFWPRPKIDSAIIKILPHKISPLPKSDVDNFFKVIHAGFLHPRKQLINNLFAGLKLDRVKIAETMEKIPINPTCRASELTVDNWRKLSVLIVENII